MKKINQACNFSTGFKVEGGANLLFVFFSKKIYENRKHYPSINFSLVSSLTQINNEELAMVNHTAEKMSANTCGRELT